MYIELRIHRVFSSDWEERARKMIQYTVNSENVGTATIVERIIWLDAQRGEGKCTIIKTNVLPKFPCLNIRILEKGLEKLRRSRKRWEWNVSVVATWAELRWVLARHSQFFIHPMKRLAFWAHHIHSSQIMSYGRIFIGLPSHTNQISLPAHL